MHLQLHRRVLAVQLHHLRLQDALTLHCHQRGGKAEWHAHLKTCGFTRLVAFLLGQQIHAVVVFAAKPQLALPRHPHRGGGVRCVAGLVARCCHQFNLARLVDLCLAQQQAARVALAGADGAQVFGFGVVVVAVEAAHHALSAAGGGAGNGLHLQRHIGRCLAIGAQRQRLKPQLFLHRHPVFCLDAGHHGGRPQGVLAAQGLHLAVRVGVGGFDQQLLRGVGARQVVECDAARALAVKGQRQLVGHHARVLPGAGLLFLALRCGLFAPARRAEAKTLVGRAKRQRLAAHQR